MTRVIQPPYQLIQFSGGGLNLGGYAQIAGYLPPVTLLSSIGGLHLGGQGLALPPVSDRGGLTLGGRARSPILVGQYSPNIARFGTTAGMTVLVNSPNSQGSQYLPDIGFPFPLYGSTYRNNIAISSNWALLFGFNALASTDISHTVPGQAFLMAASLARSWDKVSVKADNSYSYRIRFESQIASGASPIFNVFEVTLYSDGSIQLVCGTNFDFYGSFGALRVRSLTKGDNVSYADFDRPYPYTPDSASASAGVDSSYVFMPNDNAANSHAVSVGSYLPLAYYPPISSGGLRLGGRSNPNVLTGYTYSPAIATLQSSTGMTQVVSAYGDDVGQYLPDIGFNFPIYGSTYRSNISVGSNWYLLFGAVSTAFSGLSRAVPGMGLLFGAADRSWQNVYFKAGSGFCQIRFEGHVSSSGTSYAAIFQIKLFLDGTIELTIGIGAFYNPLAITPIQTLTKGDGITYADFTVPAGSTAQTDFTSTAVLTSLVFKPVDVAGNSHTVQTGSYLSSASAGLSGAIAQPQILTGSLSVGIVPAGLNGAISQPQTLAGSLSVGSVPTGLNGAINQPQTLAGSLSVGAVSVGLNGAINQPQSLVGGLTVIASVAPVISLLLLSSGGLTVSSGAINQPQSLAGSLIVRAPLSASISQTQTLTGGLSVAIPLASSISQAQSLSGSLFNVPSGLSSAIVQTQILTGSLIVAAPLVSNISQIQSLIGGLSVAKSLASNISQTQTLTGKLSTGKLLSSLVLQPQVLSGGLSLGALLVSNIIQSQSLSGSLIVGKPLSSSVSQPQVLTGGLSVVISLVSSISQPQSLSGSLPVVQRNTTLLNALSYAATNNISYSYYDASHQMPALYDGNTTSGMMATTSVTTEAVYIQMQLSASSYLNQIVFYGGQFNGAFNVPDSIKIYAGLVSAGTTAAPIYSNSALTYSATGQTIPLTALTAFDTPLTQITIAFALGGSFSSSISVNEFQLKGYVVVPTRNTTLLNALSYAALNNSSYSYYDAPHQMPALYDGNTTSGMMATTSVTTEAVYIQMQLSASSYLNQIVFYGGQFNGAFNVPDSIKIYAGLVSAGTTAAPIYSNSALTYSATGQTIPLTALTTFDTPLTQITIAFALGGSFSSSISVNEFQLKGYAA